MKRCNLYLSEETIRYLDEIKEANGASRSGSVTVAVKKYHKDTVGKDKKLIKGE